MTFPDGNTGRVLGQGRVLGVYAIEGRSATGASMSLNALGLIVLETVDNMDVSITLPTVAASLVQLTPKSVSRTTFTSECYWTVSQDAEAYADSTWGTRWHHYILAEFCYACTPARLACPPTRNPTALM